MEHLKAAITFDEWGQKQKKSKSVGQLGR